MRNVHTHRSTPPLTVHHVVSRSMFVTPKHFDSDAKERTAQQMLDIPRRVPESHRCRRSNQQEQCGVQGKSAPLVWGGQSAERPLGCFHSIRCRARHRVMDTSVHASVLRVYAESPYEISPVGHRSPQGSGALRTSQPSLPRSLSI
jgi:hypothetical protein